MPDQTVAQSLPSKMTPDMLLERLAYPRKSLLLFFDELPDLGHPERRNATHFAAGAHCRIRLHARRRGSSGTDSVHTLMNAGVPKWAIDSHLDLFPKAK